MPIIVPTVLAGDAHDFQTQVNRISSFAQRVHIDITDGVFAPTPTVAIEQVWSPENIMVDFHLMLKDPTAQLKEVIAQKPNLVIVHAEANGKFVKIAEDLHKHGPRVGVALLPRKSTHTIKPSLEHIDHVLVFSGDLGRFGGIADLSLLDRITQLKEWKPDLEIGWDGGINDQNTAALVAGGVDVLNVGGFIQRSPEPKAAYQKLTELLAQA